MMFLKARKEKRVGLIKGLILAAIDTAILPAKIIQDIFSLGGVASGRDEPYTIEQLKQIREDIEEELD